MPTTVKVEAASIDWEQELFTAQRPYVERQLGAGVGRATVVRDLVGMGADANRAAFFVDTTAKGLVRRVEPAREEVAPPLLRVYLLWAVLAGALAVLGGGLFVLGLGLDVTAQTVRDGVPSLLTVGRIEAASLLPALVVGTVLRRKLSPSLYWRPIIAALATFVAILGIRLLMVVEILHEMPGGAARVELFQSSKVLTDFAIAPTNVYGTFAGAGAGSLVLLDFGFLGLAAFVAAMFSRHPAEG
jgi:hypothetical protein